MIYLTHEQLDELVKYAADEKQIPSAEAIEALNALHSAIQRNAIRLLNGTMKRNALLEERLDKYKSRENTRIEAGEFTDSGLDSLEVATALLYQLQQLKTYKLSKYKLQAILYEMYASWLYSKRERLFIEHPVATEFGPRFWRVLRRLETGTPVPYSAWRNFTEKSPAVAKFCENAAAKYYDYAEGTLNRMFSSSKAYKNAGKEHNDGKWNKEIADADIYAWKHEQKNKQ